jgi:hypothetical protein
MPLLDELGLAVAASVACTGMSGKLAQKIHASTDLRITATFGKIARRTRLMC